MQILAIKPPKNRPINLTPSAVVKVKELLAGEDDGEALGLRMAVKPGGCSGFSYDISFDAVVETDDMVATFDGLRVMVDPQSAERIRGSVLDFKDGLMETGFAIENPNEQRSCGCGKSFA